MSNSQNVNSVLTLEGVSSVTYYDLFASSAIVNGFSVRAGVTNVGNTQPPVWTGLGATDRATYDVIGRSYYVGATAHF